MLIFGIAGICVALACIYALFRYGGLEEEYFEEFFVFLGVQALFVGAVCLTLVSFDVFSLTYLYIAIGLSFFIVLLGWIISILPARDRMDRHQRKIARAIKKGPKYKAYMEFVKEHGDRIGAVLENHAVVYAPKDVPLFLDEDYGYEIKHNWNPELGEPKKAKYASFKDTTSKWQIIRPFVAKPNERNWTGEEESVLRRIMKEALPGPKEFWKDDGWDTLRQIPQPTQIRKRKVQNPY